jgi:dUTP pyrophosphatase
MSKTPSIEIVQLPNGNDLPLPSYATSQSAGMDLYAAVENDVTIQPGQWVKIPTGISIALPEGFEAQLRSRSGLAAKHGIAVLNAPATIDADYRGEIIVLLINHGDEPFVVTRGMRFAQMIIATHATVQWLPVTTFEMMTERAAGGFGSTGI